MTDSTISSCGNCPYSSRDRKILHEIEVVSGGTNKKPKYLTLPVKTALDTIFKFNHLQKSDPQSNDPDDIGLCEICADLFIDLYTSYEAFNSPRSFGSYVATNIHEMDSLLENNQTNKADCPHEADPSPVTLVTSSYCDDPIYESTDIEPEQEPEPYPLNELSVTKVESLSVTKVESLSVTEVESLNVTQSSPSGIQTLSYMCPYFDKTPWIHVWRLTPKEIEEATRRSDKIQIPSLTNGQPPNLNFYSPSIVVKQEREEMMEEDDFYDQLTGQEEEVDRTILVGAGMESHSPIHDHDPDPLSFPMEGNEKEEWIKQILANKSTAGRRSGGNGISRFEILKCPACVGQSKVYETTRDFYLHLCTHLSKSKLSTKKRFSDNGFIKCPVCPQKLGKSSVYSHLMIHANYAPFICPIPGCGKAFSFRSAQAQHAKTNHNPKKSFKLKTSSSSSSKMKTQKIKRPLGRPKGIPKMPKTFKCESCDRECKTKMALLGHIQRKHTNHRPFQCDLCQRSFISQADLEHHTQTLMHQRLLIIQNGGSFFTEGQSQNEGQEEREGGVDNNLVQVKQEGGEDEEGTESRVAVPLKISRSLFAKKPREGLASLAKGKTKRQVCPICRKQMTNLHLHMVLAHKMQSKKNLQNLQESVKFQCPECQKYFKSSNSLKTHQQSVHSEEKFPCALCSKLFNSQMRLRLHVKRIHVVTEESPTVL